MSAPEQITVWVCDECGYWRREESTGVHQTSNPDDPNGKLVRHTLRQTEYVFAGQPKVKT